MNDKVFVSGAKLEEMAKANIDDTFLAKAMDTSIMKEFCRILLFMQLASIEFEVEQSFGHSFGMQKRKGPDKGALFEIAVDVKLRKPVRMKKQ